MNFTCPACGAEASIDVILAHEELRRLTAHVVHISLPLGTLVTRYLRLFKPAKQQLRTERAARLLGDLVGDLQRQAITRKGREWRVAVEQWKAGIEAVLDTAARGALDLPLADHAYLYESLMRLADKAEAAGERQAETDRRGRSHTAGAVQLGDLVEALQPSAASPAPAAPSPAPAQPVASAFVRQRRAEIEAIRAQRQAVGEGTPADLPKSS